MTTRKFRSITVIYHSGDVLIRSYPDLHSGAQLRYYLRHRIDPKEVKHIYFGTSEIVERTWE